MIEDLALTLSTSVGTAFYPNDSVELEKLITIADQRMYESKQKFYKSL